MASCLQALSWPPRFFSSDGLSTWQTMWCGHNQMAFRSTFTLSSSLSAEHTSVTQWDMPSRVMMCGVSRSGHSVARHSYSLEWWGSSCASVVLPEGSLAEAWPADRLVCVWPRCGRWRLAHQCRTGRIDTLALCWGCLDLRTHCHFGDIRLLSAELWMVHFPLCNWLWWIETLLWKCDVGKINVCNGRVVGN